MTIKQRFDLERDDRRHESTQARLAGRLKSACCHRCGSEDGMKAVYRDTMIQYGVVYSRSWHREPGQDGYLFYPCFHCNPDRNIPAGFIQMTPDEVLDWVNRNTNPMAPDYAALAAEEPVLASLVDRDSAGI